MTHHEIILIEDQEVQVKEIKDCLEKFAKERSNNDCDYCFVYIKGALEDSYEEEKYFFYDESVIKEIEKNVRKQKNIMQKKVIQKR